MLGKRYVQDYVPVWSPLVRGDLFMASFPKSGNTFLRFLWANLELELQNVEKTVDFEVLDNEFRCEYEAGEYGGFPYRHLPRAIKTHLPRHFVPLRRAKSILIIRHPGDTLASYHRYLNSYVQHPVQDMSFGEFIRSSRYGMDDWIAHTSSWLNSADSVVGYEEMFLKPADALQQILAEIGLPKVPADRIRRAVEKSSVDNVRKLEKERGKSDHLKARLRADASFAGSGKPGRWREAFSPADIDWCKARLSRAGLERYWAD